MKEVTANQVAKTVFAQTDVNIKNLEDSQKLNFENIQETARIQREEMQRAQKLQTETNFMGTHALNQQTEVLKKSAESLGNMGDINTGSSSGGMNPAGMMTGMMMGGALGNQMAGMMNNLGQNMQNGQNVPPAPPQDLYYIAVEGQTKGPFNLNQLQGMVNSGEINKNSYLWKNGMDDWKLIMEIKELSNLFTSNPPPPPKFD